MSSSRDSSRRNFLKMAGLGGLALGAAATPALGAAPREAAANAAQSPAKNVIFMVADGMNIAALSLAHTYLQRTVNQTSQWMKLYRELPVVRALCETQSASSLVTDSAAAASCWGIGERITNGVINITPDGRKPVTMMQKMRKAKKRTGLVTTATATHATPAGFVATVASRAKQAEIAPQYLERGVDVVLGGGTQYFSETLMGDYRKAGYAIALNRTELLAYKGGAPLLGLFDKSHLPFEIDRLNDPAVAAHTPTVSEMTEAALRCLQDSPDGFFLLVEGGRVDHAAHANDAAATIHDQIAFDAAITTVLRFIEKHPDTLLVITTDHGTGGLQLNGMGSEDLVGKGSAYSESTPAFMRLTKFTMSQEAMVHRLKEFGPKGLAAQVVEKTGLEFKADDLSSIKDMKSLQDVLPKYIGISWTSHHHTSEMVEFCAYGPGSGLFTPYLRNDEVHAILLKAMGLSA
ncbi:MAG: twin-arginine translocation signal domain-containing protein [Verrucomicrobia bacterium]|nr:twin-arginine translocation signal domain-containing protein [Verrucomicrobiota bacterium]NBS04529.1 twin-arginine translocation signal domain-containing protein [Verrucomicrobiota bacterium]NBY36563.1 twin-arginine translocation signal domain-containing protein [Verrucomicrobiota bacterium]